MKIGDTVRFYTNTTDQLYDWPQTGFIKWIFKNKDGEPIKYLIENAVMRYEIYPHMIKDVIK